MASPPASASSPRSASAASSAPTSLGAVGDGRVRPRSSDRRRLEVVAELLAGGERRSPRPRGRATSVTRSPSSSRTWASPPHSGGGWAPGGGGGANGFMVANIRPMNPSGVQLSSPMVPPGRVTRSSSSAAPLVVRREHHAQARDHRVERGVGVRQRLRVPLLASRRSRRPPRPPPSGLEELRGEVGRDHSAPRQGRGDGRVAGPGRDVEHALAAAIPAARTSSGPRSQIRSSARWA